MQIIVDTKHDDAATMRIAASLLLTLSGDMVAETDPQAATGEQFDKHMSLPARAEVPAPAIPPAPAPPPPPVIPTAPAASPPGPLVPPPPPLPANTADTSTTTVAQAATTAAGASTAASAVYDSAGIPWDARIHQKKQGKKQDGTWKLIKGIDSNIVTEVVKELQAAKLPASITSGAAPPVPTGTATAAPPVPLPPPPASAVPVPPVPPAVPTAVEGLPAPSAAPGASVPVPPAPADGAVTYRSLLDKVIKAAKDNKLSPQKVNEIVTSCGAPSLQGLVGLPNLFDEVNIKLDLALAGLG